MKFIFIIALLTLASCAHHRDVRPNSQGKHMVRFNTEAKSEGYANAFSQARNYCEEVEKKNAYVIKEGYKYVGEMDEDTYKTTKTASKVASGVGSAGMVFGGEKERNAGGVLGIGGGIANAVAGEGYEYTMYFNCK